MISDNLFKRLVDMCSSYGYQISLHENKSFIILKVRREISVGLDTEGVSEEGIFRLFKEQIQSIDVQVRDFKINVPTYDAKRTSVDDSVGIEHYIGESRPRIPEIKLNWYEKIVEYFKMTKLRIMIRKQSKKMRKED